MDKELSPFVKLFIKTPHTEEAFNDIITAAKQVAINNVIEGRANDLIPIPRWVKAEIERQQMLSD